MGKRILIIDAHPDPRLERFIHALATAYKEAALASGHEVRLIVLAEVDFPLLRTADDFLKGEPPPVIHSCQIDLAWCEHLVILYPLWLGSMPALSKAFFEQVMRPGFAYAASGRGFPKKLLAGRSARVIVTMGMPGLFYRWYFRAHSLKSLERNLLGFVGFGPIRASVIGSVEGAARKRQAWLTRMRRFARAAK